MIQIPETIVTIPMNDYQTTTEMGGKRPYGLYFSNSSTALAGRSL